MKPCRYYVIEGETALIYDTPDPARSLSCSAVPVSELSYYRRTFYLRKCWTN